MWSASVVPGLGTGDLQGFSGIGTFEAPLGRKAWFELDCQFNRRASRDPNPQ
jgi:hypothetical protein